METKLQKSFHYKSFNGNADDNISSNSFGVKKINTSKCEYSDDERMKIVRLGQSGSMSINELCLRKGISTKVFSKWSKELLVYSKNAEDTNVQGLKNSDDYRFQVVLEGKRGDTSVAEICRRESISHDTFLEWCGEFLDLKRKGLQDPNCENSVYNRNRLLFEKISDLRVFNYIEKYVNFSKEETLTFSNLNGRKLESSEKLSNIIGLVKVNDIRYINKYFEKINLKLSKEGVFIGCLETFTARRKRKGVNRIAFVRDVYFGIEFLLKRILPKLSLTKKYYFDFTKGNDRLLSKAEGLGRLVSCGFKIMDYKTINGLLYFVVKKQKKPLYDLNPSYGPIYRMPRIGKNGKIIKVYKFRTMHPYSEYIQDYVLNVNGYADSGKPAEDFRIPEWGKLMRKFWIDEIPQLINVLTGTMKIVGVRPVSERYFQDIPKEMQKLRLTQKPGCIPPYVSLNRKGNVMSVLQAEKEYLEAKILNPYSTDIKYFFKALFNIIFRNKRSA